MQPLMLSLQSPLSSPQLPFINAAVITLSLPQLPYPSCHSCCAAVTMHWCHRHCIIVATVSMPSRCHSFHAIVITIPSWWLLIVALVDLRLIVTPVDCCSSWLLLQLIVAPVDCCSGWLLLRLIVAGEGFEKMQTFSVEGESNYWTRLLKMRVEVWYAKVTVVQHLVESVPHFR